MNDKQHSYFHLSKNEYGKMWLMYNPDEDGRFKCWEPITGAFWQEFEKLLNAKAENSRLQQLIKEKDEEIKSIMDSLVTACDLAGIGINVTGILKDLIGKHKAK